MKKTVCEKNQCVGCMACVDLCNQKAIQIIDEYMHYNAYINDEKCIKCGVCKSACQVNNPLKGKKPIVWYEGWAKCEDIRAISSSGGFATAIMKNFIKEGGVVWSCTFEQGEFIYKEANTEEEINSFSGSKYIKSKPEGAYQAIRTRLKENRKVLFIGLPCHVAALYKVVKEENIERLYTVDLICHGTPSPQILKDFLMQYDINMVQLKNIKFRNKTRFALSVDNKSIIMPDVCDKYSLAFLFSMIYTENCYSCSYASLERISDLTLGDSWGTRMPEAEQMRGISLALCQSMKGVELIQNADLYIERVDIERAVVNNQQLQHPSKKPSKWINIFDEIQNGKKINCVIKKYLPWQCLKMELKALLKKLKII